MHEEWRPIQGHAGYQVSSLGRVRRLNYTILYADGATENRPEKLLTCRPESDGMHVNFHNKNFLVHRLLAEAFLPEPDESCYVQFKDKDKYNCTLDNIYYASISDIVRTAIKDGKRKSPSSYIGMPIICLETEETWPSIKALSESLNLSRSVITRKIRNHQPIQSYHYRFM